MRMLTLWLVLANAALIGAAVPASAQSPYSYPWCSRQTTRDTSTTSCYFISREQCMATISGIGGYCYQNPYHRQAPGRSKGRQTPAGAR